MSENPQRLHIQICTRCGILLLIWRSASFRQWNELDRGCNRPARLSGDHLDAKFSRLKRSHDEASPRRGKHWFCHVGMQYEADVPFTAGLDKNPSLGRKKTSWDES
jgi:hypothetical protein